MKLDYHRALTRHLKSLREEPYGRNLAGLWGACIGVWRVGTLWSGLVHWGMMGCVMGVRIRKAGCNET